LREKLLEREGKRNVDKADTVGGYERDTDLLCLVGLSNTGPQMVKQQVAVAR
jgi:hypothetical protein